MSAATKILPKLCPEMTDCTVQNHDRICMSNLDHQCSSIFKVSSLILFYLPVQVEQQFCALKMLTDIFDFTPRSCVNIQIYCLPLIQFWTFCSLPSVLCFLHGIFFNLPGPKCEALEIYTEHFHHSDRNNSLYVIVYWKICE